MVWVALAVWIYLLIGRGFFWILRETPAPAVVSTARVAVVIPARDEAANIGRAVASLLQQDFPGYLQIFLVDDHSTDGTARAAGSSEHLTVIPAPDLPPGWTGKLWAMSQGVAAAQGFDYLLFTDADIVHAPRNVAELVAHAEAGRFDMVSLMVELSQHSLAERALIPAFVFFFFMLYPPKWGTGAAGGCMLVRPEALHRAGGLAAIRGELIDDCALAREVRRAGGRIWLGPTRATTSIREYQTFGEIWRMISRTAFTQLRYSAWMVAGSLLAMTAVFLAPPVSFTAPGIAAWALMSLTFLPTLLFYRRSPLWAPLLPLVALFYMGATLDSAIRHWQGQGGEWKGRTWQSH